MKCKKCGALYGHMAGSECLTNRQAHEEAAGMGLDPSFFTHNGIDPDGEYFKSCDNCNQVYEREYSNGGKQCFGLVKDTHRECDVVRACQKYDNGKMFLQDLSPDEAAEMATGYAAVVRTWFSFFYKRPCETCDQKESDCNVAE